MKWQSRCIGLRRSPSRGRASFASFLMGYKYLKAAQRLLDELVNVCEGIKDVKIGKEATSKNPAAEADGGGNVVAANVANLTAAERQELQMKEKLADMLKEVEERYVQAVPPPYASRSILVRGYRWLRIVENLHLACRSDDIKALPVPAKCDRQPSPAGQVEGAWGRKMTNAEGRNFASSISVSGSSRHSNSLGRCSIAVGGRSAGYRSIMFPFSAPALQFAQKQAALHEVADSKLLKLEIQLR